jgi:Kdo2-lipid IVA lauroyltransferase/acyltransferase
VGLQPLQGAEVSALVLWLLRLVSARSLPTQARLGRALGKLLWLLAISRRKIALKNLALCFPEQLSEERRAVAKQHFEFLARSFLERGLLWHADEARLRSLIEVTGELEFADNSEAPVMWLVPHFVGLDVAGIACMLFVKKPFASIYQAQRNPVIDAAMRAGRMRFGKTQIFPRSDSVRPLLKCIKQGAPFFNLPDMDFGARDAAFVPFFGVNAATLTAPSRIARSAGMRVQLVTAHLKPDGSGYRVHFSAPLEGFPSEDAIADAQRMNHLIEQEVLKQPAQYLWVHKRFKTRPEGEPSLYD